MRSAPVRAAWLASLLVVVVGLLVAAPASGLRVGYNDEGPRFTVAAQAVAQSNTQIARFGVDWAKIEPEDDQWDFTSIDATVDLLRREGIRPILAVTGSPSWAGAGKPGIQCPCDREADPAWQQMWQVLAARYPDAILNVWNEPNLSAYGGVSIERMAELVNEAAAAIWQVDPDRIVLGPPAAPVGKWQAYIASLYSIINKRVDMAANLYPYGHLRENFRRDLKTVRRIAHKRSVWITEANVSTSGTYPVSAKRQASMIRYMYALAKKAGAKALIFHRLWSPYSPNPHDSGVFSWDGGQSALHIDGTPRRMYGVIGKLHSGYRPARLPRIPAAQIPPVTYSQFAPTQNTTAACPG